MGAGHRQVSAGPEADIVWQGAARAGHEVRDALQAGELHIVGVLHLVLVLLLIRGRAAGKQPVDHKLKKTVLSRELGPAPEGDFPDPVDRITVFTVLAGQAYVDVVFTQPPEQADEAGIDL